ncbi:GrpB family protein [Melghirimyces thermohalophilus]|uniref:GrpB family protein n=1 Tax=Melghirimyces thermohalophilus TaxID=1236220 RepID=UPI002480E58D|nr:GrpB family protein [Melghirimyces thermohalophilus]
MRHRGSNPTHHVHIFQYDYHLEIDRHLAVKDDLRMHQKEAHRYGELKERSAHQFPNDREAYSKGKDRFVKELERKALQWGKNRKGE